MRFDTLKPATNYIERTMKDLENGYMMTIHYSTEDYGYHIDFKKRE